MRPDTMKIESVQCGERFFADDAPVVSRDSVARVCHNLRRRSPGELEHTGTPAVAAIVGGEPLLADRRGNGYFILRQEDDGCLIVDGYLNDLGGYDKLSVNLGDCGKRIVQAESAGEFVVLRYSDGILGYLLFHRDLESYTLLGALPEIPELNVTPAMTMDMTEVVDGVEFHDPVDDIRSGVDGDTAERIGKAMKEAWERLRMRAEKTGYWLEPVNVRFALRLWDGSLLYISEAMRVCADAENVWQCGGRAAMKLLTDTNGRVTGTAPSSITARGYRLAIDPGTIDLGKWNDVVRSVELLTTKEFDPADGSAQPVVGVGIVDRVDCLLCSLRQLPQERLEYMILNSGYGCHKMWLLGEETSIIERNAAAEYAPLPQYDGVLHLPDFKVCSILGHDGFLHLATKDGLITTHRGNPLYIYSSTPGDWSGVRVMTPQIWGGGAYTRQIIYVADHRGVSALAHRADGMHSNCRLICRSSPLNAELVAAAPGSVFMLTGDGSLMRFDGTKTYTILTGIAGCASIFADARYGELWLTPSSPNGHCVVLGSEMRGDVSTRNRIDVRHVPGAGEYMMHLLDNGLVELYHCGKNLLSNNNDDTASRWLGSMKISPSSDMMRNMECGIYGDDINVMLRFGQNDGSGSDTYSPKGLSEMHITGQPKGRLSMRIRSGGSQSGTLHHRGEWRVELKGFYDCFDWINVA